MSPSPAAGLLLAATLPFLGGCHFWNERFLCIEGRLPDAPNAPVEAWLPRAGDVMRFPGTPWEELVAGPRQYAVPVPPEHVEPVLAAGREGGLVGYPLPRHVGNEDVLAGRQDPFGGEADAEGNWRVVYVRTVKVGVTLLPFLLSKDEANPPHALVIRVGRPGEPERESVLLLVVREDTPDVGEVWRYDPAEPTLWRRAGTVEQVEILPGGNRWVVRLAP